MPIDLPSDAPPRPAMITEHVLGSDALRQRGATLAIEALSDWSLLTPAGRGAAISGLPATLVRLDGVRLVPAPDGRVDLSLLPLQWLGSASISAGPAGLGAGSVGGVIELDTAGEDEGNRLWALAGGQAGRGIGGLDVRIGGEDAWIGGGYVQGGALPTPAGLAATGQGRFQLGGRFATGLGGATLVGRGWLAGRRDGGSRADHHDLALQLAGGTAWRWQITAATGGQGQITAATGGQVAANASSRQHQLIAGASRTTGLRLPGAIDPVMLMLGGEVRQLRLAAGRAIAREAHASAEVPILQDRAGAEDLAVDIGWRQAWIARRSEPLWHARARWEFFPGLALRGQVARGIDDLATTNGSDDPAASGGVGHSIGLIAVPAFVPGVALAIDWRRQTAGLARIAALDINLSVRRPLAGTAQIIVTAMATHHQRAAATPLPVARLAALLRIGIEQGDWLVSAGWRHRSSLAAVPVRDAIDASVQRRLSDRISLIASVGNATDTGAAIGAPVGRQALVQVIAGF